MKKNIFIILLLLVMFVFTGCEEKLCKLTLDYNDAYGSITINDEVSTSKSFVKGTEVTIEATPKANYEFGAYYLGSLSGRYLTSSSSYTLTITEDTTIFGLFREYTQEIVKLGTPSLNLNGSILSWNSVTNATEYHLYVNGETVAFKTTTELSIDLADYYTNEGTYTIGVRAFNSTNSSDVATRSYVVTGNNDGDGDGDGDGGSTDVNKLISTHYQGTYYQSVTLTNSGNTLKSSLRSLITTTHTNILSYNDLKTVYVQADADPDKPGNIILFYCRGSINGTWSTDSRYNREHVWPKSQGWFDNNGAGSDAHHIRPTDKGANATRGNLPFGEGSGGTPVYTTGEIGRIDTLCYTNGGYFIPREKIRGDIARIIFYLLVRYSQSDSYAITNVAQSMDMLLRWNEADPVDQSEITRNEAVFNIQGNRNPFIDYPELADFIWEN